MSFVVPSLHNRGVKRNAHGAPAGTAPRRMPVPPVPSPLVNGNNTRKTNGVKEVVKKKKSINTQQHNDGLTKLWTQYIEDSAVIPNLMEELKDNLIIGGATDSKEDVKIRKVMTKEDRIGHWRAIMARITAILERKYDRLVRHDCSSNSDEGSTKINLTFMVNALKEMHGEYPIQPDWVRWAITKLMLLLTGKIVYDKMGMNICDHLLTLLQFLKDDKAETSDLLQTMIGQMHALTQQAKSITFTRATVPPELRAEIQMEWRNGCENVIMLSIVDLLLIHPLFDFPSLPSRIQLQLWASLFHLLNTRSQNAQHSSVQLMQRLLYRDLASLEIVRLVVEYGVAFFKKYPPSKKESEKEVNLRVTIIDIVQLLTDHLRKLGRSKLLKGAQATVLIGWAVSVLGLAETWNLDKVEEEREAGLNGQRNILRTFSLICCRILSSIQLKSATQLKDPLKELVEAVKRLITVSLHEWALPSPAHRVGMTAAAAAAAAEERMACAANFLLFSDDLNGNEENSLWISKETDKTLKACSDRMDAALRARHLMISSLAPTKRARRASAEDQASQKSQKGAAGDAATAAAAATPSTNALLQRLLPDNNQILQYIHAVDKLPPIKGETILQALFSLVAQIIPLSQSMTATAVAVLSLPWMATDADILQSFKRHTRSLPLLKELYPLTKIVKNACTSSSLLRECTLKPLASLPRPPQFSEWRRSIFEKALTLTPSRKAPSMESVSIVKSALDSLASFTSSVEPGYYEKTLALVIELIDMEELDRSPVHVEHVVRAVADSLCALDGVSRKMNEGTGEYRCTACEKLQRDLVPTAKTVSVPKDFVKLMVKVFSDDSVKTNTIENRIDAYSILFAMLCHVQDAVKRFEEVIIASLALINDKDEDIRKDYAYAFKVIVSMNPSQKLIQAIMDAFEINDDEVHSQEQEQRIFESSAPFLAHCASESHDVKFRQWSRERMYARALQLPSSTLLTQFAHDLHISEAKKDPEIGADPKRFFVRQTRTLTRMLSSELLSTVVDWWKDRGEYKEDEWIKEVTQDCDYVLHTAARIWGFDSIQSLLRSCASHLVAECIVVEHAVHGAATMVIERVRVHLDRERRSLIEECVPSIVERIIKASTASQSAAKLAKEYCGASMRDLLNARRYHCTFFVLRMMAENEEKALQLLMTINRLEKKDEATLTNVLKIRCEYLGYLLSLRRSLLEDESYDLRGKILKSIRVIITMLEESFLDEIASKLMMVLRAATAVGEEAVEVWTAFVEKLGNGMLVSLLPQILIAVQPLLRFESSSGLLKTIFEQRDALKNEQSASFERAVMVLLGGEGSFEDDDGSMRIRKYLSRRRVTPATSEDVILGCARMLHEEGETVGRVVLRRLVSTLDGRPLRDDLAAAVMPALLHTIRVCADADVRLAAAKCIGLVGAVDPGRLGLSLEAQRREGKGVEMGGGGVKKILFVNSSNKEFFVDLLTRAWRVYASLTDADMIDIASFAIQSLLSKLVGPNDENGVFKRLPEECKRDIGPFLKTSLTNNQELKANDVKGKCLVNEVGTFPDWLLQNFLVGVKEIKNSELHDIFKALKWLVYTRDTAFARHLLPHLIIIMLMERREIMLEHYGREMIEVLRRTIDPQSANWTRLAAHVVFSIVDTLERYAISKSEASRKDADHKKVIDLIKRVCSEKLADGSLLVVVAAEKCQCLLRALRWCEQFAIGGGVTEYAHASESAEFDRAPFYDLERLYMQLNEVDGVAGAFATISKSTAPTADERILDLEANGDYTEALPLYAYSGEQKELKLLECLLRLNQPQLALSRAAMEQRGSVRDASTSRAIEAAQLEAAWHLRDWGRLDEMIKKRDPLSSGETGWGAACASIMSTIHHRKENQITVKTDRARSNLVERLTALTIEDSDTYAQSYKYIAQLHMLAEIDDAKVQLFNDSQVACKEQVDEIMKYWEDRSESVAQCASSIEPMLRVRRELLRAAGGDIGESTKDGVCGLLLQSCRLARQAGHLQIAWTFLVEAKALETCHQAVGMEEARFEFQKGNQSEAIGLLSRLLNVRFSKMHEIFSVFSNQSPVGSQAVLATQTNAAARSKLSVEELKINAKSLVAQQRKEERAAYAEVQLLRTEYMLKAGASAPEDLYKTYLGLKKLEVQSEDLHYRVAVFIDSLLNMAEIRSDLIPNILDSYGQVIKCGRSHLFHAVPRMLTIWLDVTQKWAEEACTYAPTSSDREKRVKEIRALNQTMRGIIESLPLSVFFPSFPQLISRILHPDQSVFEELMNVLAKLIVAFPHQCLWQAIAVYRDAPDPMQDKHSEKMIKCKQVFERAKMLDKTKTLDDLIDQYDYFARQLINIAESDKVRSDPERLISKHFKHLHNFFKFNKLETMLLLGSKTRKLVGVRSIKPKIMMPMTEMLEQSISEEDAKASTFSQFNVVDSPLSAVRESPIVEAVFIQDIVDEFVVMSSMMAPRKISLRGSDGKLYSLLCKKDDELRKDARLMSFCKMMNCLMRRTPEARRRQLAVRTFSAIPLQSGGGIIEWVPNLNTFKQTLKPLFIEYQVKNLQRIDYNDKWPIDQKLKMMRDHFYKVYPQVAAEWQRRAFSDPCSWHTARLLFTRSCAVMSMIGFVCGLGDRHADNILIDQTDGGIMHVDFNILFNRGEKLGVPEIVPFRLTRNLVDGFGPTGVEGTWKKSAEATLEVMRANAETLLTVMQAFIYDPLCEFGEGRAQQNKTGQRKMTEQKSSKPSVNEVLEMIKYRLEGHIVTPLTLKKHSLTKKMSVNGQVTKLYELATDETKLCQMFSGWSPYL